MNFGFKGILFLPVYSTTTTKIVNDVLLPNLKLTPNVRFLSFVLKYLCKPSLDLYWESFHILLLHRILMQAVGLGSWMLLLAKAGFTSVVALISLQMYLSIPSQGTNSYY